jgi:hypothetical protein
VGYESASAFVAAFRRETGMTPAAYFRLPPRQAGAGPDERPVGPVTAGWEGLTSGSAGRGQVESPGRGGSSG